MNTQKNGGLRDRDSIMFSVDEISRRRHRHEKSPQIEKKFRRQNDVSESNSMPYMKSHRDKKSLSRLNLAGEKTMGIHRSLSQLEEEFIFAAEFGDIPTVKRVLDEQPGFNVDYHDIIGRTPLRLAVGNEHLEVVELLLDRSNVANIHEALLQAISAGHEQIAETILKHPKYTDVKKENKRFGETDYFFNTTNEDSPFSSDITPLILAAERNQFEIVQLLLLRGETIKKPHHYYCNCQECSNKLEFDQLRLAKTRLNAYKGLASGAYISLSSKDPILTAFELAQELRKVAKVEKYYKNEYLALADQLSEYVVKLLDKVRGHDELEILMNKKRRDASDETYEQLSRLKLAIHYNEKKFVAHPSCQQKLVSIWYDDLRSMERSNWFGRSVMVFGITSVYPILSVLYWFFPRSKLGKFLRYPCIKFIGHTMSFAAFLIMMVISSVAEGASVQRKLSSFPQVYPHYVWYKSRSNYTLPMDFVVRTSRPELIHLCLTIWIIGMLWQEVKQIYGDGIYDYFDSLYNYLDVAVLTLYITSFTLRNVSIWKVNTSLDFFTSRERWQDLLANASHANEHMYWLIADRYYWHSLDPYNVAEGLFAIANVISVTRVSYILPANEMFGPMQISLARMLTDIIKFLCIFSVIFIAFMIGLHNLYWYYPKSVRQHVEFLPNNITTRAESSFGVPDKTFRTVFWSLFGRGEPEVVELGEFNHIFTQYVGYWIFGVYNFAGVIVLLNMLIAMMSRSFEIIQEDSDTEWKFARSKLYMEYIKTDATLPIPFNIIPSPKSVFNVFHGCYRLCCKTEDPDLRPHPGRIKDIELYSVTGGTAPTVPGWEETANGNKKGIKRFQERMQTTNGFVRSDSDHNIYEEKLTYKRVMKRIVKRYIFDVQQDDERPDGDFEEVKQDISSFRYEILNHLETRNHGTAETTDRVMNLESKLDLLMRQQSMLIKQLCKGCEPGNLDQRLINLSQSSPDLRRHKDTGILSESAYSSFEEQLPNEDEKDNSSCGRPQTLEGIPEEDIKEEVTTPKQDSSEAHRLTRQQTLETYLHDVIVEMKEPTSENIKEDAHL